MSDRRSCILKILQQNEKGLYRMHYYVHLDRGTSEQAGPDDTFQVVSIEDDDGNSYTESIGLDQCIHFHSLEELAEEIERRTGEPVELDEA